MIVAAVPMKEKKKERKNFKLKNYVMLLGGSLGNEGGAEVSDEIDGKRDSF
jgi:hypothetical protein